MNNNWININEFSDYLFCPEYWWKRREHHAVYPDITGIKARLNKRREMNQQGKQQKPKVVKKKGRKKRKNKQSSIGQGFLFISLLLVVMYFISPTYFYMLLGLMLLLGGLVVWFKIKERGISVFNSSKNIHVSSFLRQEQKVNPTLNLVDPEFNIFGEVPGVKLRNGSLVITLDRSDEQLPSYLPLIKKKDLFILALYMRLLNINFFTNQIIGEVYYKNYTKPKVLRWEHQKTRQIVNNVVTEVKVLIKKIRPASQKYFPALFFRCAECEFFRNGCQKRTQLKFQRVKQNREEDIVELHRNFLQIKSKIEKTSWEHWKNDIQDFARFISSSPTMQKVINKIYRHKRNYDIEEAIETSAIHGTGLYNEYMITRRSRKEEITFSYQLLMYLSIKANKKTMAKFFGSDDVRDQKVREFFDKVFRNLYFEINNYLVSLIPENVAQNNYITFNNSMINLANDEGLINASMNIGVEQDEEDDD